MASEILLAEQALLIVDAAFPDIAIAFPSDCKWIVNDWSESCWEIGWGRKSGELQFNRSSATVDQYRFFLMFSSCERIAPEDPQVFKVFLNGHRVYGKSTENHLFASLKEAIAAVYLFSSALKPPLT